MFEFIKALFRPKQISTPFPILESPSSDARMYLIPKSEIKVPMPPCQPTKNACRMDLQEVKNKKIEELAYYLAESDGFRGDPLSYWLQAEKRVKEEVG